MSVSQDILRDLNLSANLIRNDVLDMLKLAGSGHLGGSFSAAEILSVLFNHELKIDASNPNWSERDRFILSKGHSNPGLYAILCQKGFFSRDEYQKLRKINSILQGHPERITPGVEYIAGFLGQGLSAGCGMALGFKREKKENRVFVLIGDGDNLEGQTWEAARFAVQNKLDNLTAIFDYNNILSDDTTDNVLSIKDPEKQWSSFGWNVIIINGHDIVQILKALELSKKSKDLPTMIIANTRKGHGISIWDDTAKSHGSWGPSDEDYSKGKKELEINRQKISAMNFKDSEIKFLEPMIKLKSDREENSTVKSESNDFPNYRFKLGEKISLRSAFGMAAANLAKIYKNFDLFDADVKSGTMAVSFEKHFPNRFIQCGIVEQNMVSAAAGYYLATGRIPIVTTYAVFTSLLTAAQFRNGVAIQKLPLIIASSHVGIDTGPDGPTHQAIEDLGIFSTYPGVQVLSPCDGNKLEAVLEAAIISGKPTYMRTGRSPVPVIHPPEIKYEIGNDEVLYEGNDVSIFATGIMVHRAIKAMELLKKENIGAEIIDITSIKPLDRETILKSVKKTNCAVTAEDHYVRNGMGSGISQLIGKEHPVLTYNIGVEKYAESGNPEDLATKYGLQSENIVNVAKQIVHSK
ncbi:MAG TPA: transketolase [Pelagibacteraceae bacterium]|nr:transketolase [Pelagibacteraceae bacterium]